MCAAPALAAVYSCSCGTNATWSLDTKTGLLKIEGRSAMKDYSCHSYAPWYSYNSSITKAEIADGISSIGEWTFYGCLRLTSVTIPNSVTSIGDYAFGLSSALTEMICETVTPPTVSSSVWRGGRLRASSGCIRGRYP